MSVGRHIILYYKIIFKKKKMLTNLRMPLQSMHIFKYSYLVKTHRTVCDLFELTGGTEDVEKSTGKRYRKGFVGCISDFILNTDYQVKLSWSTGTERVCIS